MRTRTVNIPTVLDNGSLRIRRHFPPLITAPVLQDTTTNSTGSVLASTYDTNRTIVDEVQPPKHRREGYCDHSAKTFTLWGFTPSVSLVVVDPSVGGSLYEYDCTLDHLVNVYMKPRMTFLTPSMTFKAKDWAEFSYDALKTMRPKFSELSLANDVLELRQIRDLAKPLGKKAGSILGRGQKSYFNSASNLLLWQKFGVEPLANSIVEVTKLMRSLASTVADIRKRAKRLQKRHYACPIHLNTTDLPGDGYIYTENVGNYRETGLYRECRWVDTPMYHATLFFRYDVSRLTDLELMTRAWLEASGLNRPLGVLWNAIPYSFVVDWFVNIGEWAESLLYEPAIPIVIEDFSHSVKWSYRTDIRIEWLKKALVLPIASSEVSHYERRRDVPSLLSKVRFKEPSMGSVILGTALVGQASRFRKERNAKRPPSTAWLRYDNKTLLR